MRFVSSRDFWIGVILTLVALYGYRYVSGMLAARNSSSSQAA